MFFPLLDDDDHDLFIHFAKEMKELTIWGLIEV